MKFYYKLISVILLSMIFISALGWYNQIKNKNQTKEIYHDSATYKINIPHSLEAYYLIEKYSKKYGVPKHIAYGIAYRESRYKGPFDWNYQPNISSSSAHGIMQIQIQSAKMMTGKNISADSLCRDMDLNIRLAMQILVMLKDRYGNWKIALGIYNTGKPIINSYANNIINFNPEQYFIL